MRKRPCGCPRDTIRKPGGAAFRYDDTLRPSRECGSHNGAEILRVLDAVEKNQQAGGGVRIARFQQILKARRGRCGNECHDALMFPRAGGAIELYALLKTYRNAVLPRQTHQLLNSVAVAASRDNQGIERTIRFERFSYGVDTGEPVHGFANPLFNRERRKIPGCECERILQARVPRCARRDRAAEQRGRARLSLRVPSARRATDERFRGWSKAAWF